MICFVVEYNDHEVFPFVMSLFINLAQYYISVIHVISIHDRDIPYPQCHECHSTR